MELRAEEITSVIRKEITDYQEQLKMESVGTVLTVGDCVARIYGLEKCKSSELLEFEGGVYGIACKPIQRLLEGYFAAQRPWRSAASPCSPTASV